MNKKFCNLLILCLIICMLSGCSKAKKSNDKSDIDVNALIDEATKNIESIETGTIDINLLCDVDAGDLGTAAVNVESISKTNGKQYQSDLNATLTATGSIKTLLTEEDDKDSFEIIEKNYYDSETNTKYTYHDEDDTWVYSESIENESDMQSSIEIFSGIKELATNMEYVGTEKNNYIIEITPDTEKLSELISNKIGINKTNTDELIKQLDTKNTKIILSIDEDTRQVNRAELSIKNVDLTNNDASIKVNTFEITIELDTKSNVIIDFKDIEKTAISEDEYYGLTEPPLNETETE